MDRVTVKFAKLCRVQRAWAREMYDGQFADLQPEKLRAEQWQNLQEFLARRPI